MNNRMVEQESLAYPPSEERTELHSKLSPPAFLALSMSVKFPQVPYFSDLFSPQDLCMCPHGIFPIQLRFPLPVRFIARLSKMSLDRYSVGISGRKAGNWGHLMLDSEVMSSQVATLLRFTSRPELSVFFCQQYDPTEF